MTQKERTIRLTETRWWREEYSQAKQAGIIGFSVQGLEQTPQSRVYSSLPQFKQLQRLSNTLSPKTIRSGQACNVVVVVF